MPLNVLVVGLLSVFVVAPDFQSGDQVFPKKTPAKLKIGRQVVAKISSFDYLTVLEVEGEWLWVESSNLLTQQIEHKGWIRANDVEGISVHRDNIKAAASQDPPASELFALLGLIEDLNGDHKQAIASLGRAIQIDPTNSLCYFIRGQLLVRRDQYEKALEDVEHACRLAPDNEKYRTLAEIVRELIRIKSGNQDRETSVPARSGDVVVPRVTHCDNHLRLPDQSSSHKEAIADNLRGQN